MNAIIIVNFTSAKFVLRNCFGNAPEKIKKKLPQVDIHHYKYF